MFKIVAMVGQLLKTSQRINNKMTKCNGVTIYIGMYIFLIYPIVTKALELFIFRPG